MNLFGRLASHGLRSFGLGMAVSLTYYVMLHQSFMKDSMLHAYTAHHATEYLIVILFFWANSELLLCFFRVQRERRHLDNTWLPARNGIEEPEEAPRLLTRLNENFGDLKDTLFFRRIQAALTFVAERRSASGFREFLESLSHRSEDEVHARYSFSRFVTAVLPILGLIGTVVHFGIALSGLSMDGLEKKIPGLLSGMGTAFNTTFTAMSCMATTLLVRFLVERMESESLRKIDDYVEDNLQYRFSVADEKISPYLAIIHQSNTLLIDALTECEATLANEWNSKIEAQQQRWESLEAHRDEQWKAFLTLLADQHQSRSDDWTRFEQQLEKVAGLMSEVASTIDGDGKLLALQERLTTNLTALRESEQFDTAMHELTAAIHLLTARSGNSTSNRRAA